MSDFHQHGPITTLHRLAEGRAGAAEEMLRAASVRCDVWLVVPCHASDLLQPPLQRIAQELDTADWLQEIVLVTNGGGCIPAIWPAARWLASDGPAAEAFAKQLVRRGLASPLAVQPSKAWNVWLGLGAALAEGARVVATHDADIATYERDLLARLCLPIAQPEMGYDFVKGYHRRVTEGVMFGRVTRLFFAPLLRACLRIGGHHPLLDFLGAFRYPLAGECAFRGSAVADLPVTPGWGLETGLLCAAHAQLPPARMAQSEMGSNYDHKHRALGDGVEGLASMAAEVGAALLEGLRAEGMNFEASAGIALTRAYERAGAEAVTRHAHDAQINGLTPRREDESAAVRMFTGVLTALLAQGRSTPAPRLPPWSHVFSAWPEARDLMAEL